MLHGNGKSGLEIRLEISQNLLSDITVMFFSLGLTKTSKKPQPLNCLKLLESFHPVLVSEIKIFLFDRKAAR